MGVFTAADVPTAASPLPRLSVSGAEYVHLHQRKQPRSAGNSRGSAGSAVSQNRLQFVVLTPH